MMKWFYLLALCASFTEACAASFKIECPAQIASTSLRLSGTPTGWRGHVSSPLFLHNAAPIDGPPEDLGSLMGETIKESKNHWVIRYSLDGPFPKGKWFTCDYGSLNEVSLSRQLPGNTMECTVTGRKGVHAGENTFEIVCRN
ncbi:STY0301 family protein [Massilia endophytica]|uniref:STY0301 family protein n=1 Tax=Massilia endophytica TaxID=2899220 RepID=UPI001E3D2CAC|nr:STY0301 family protein [Massilia endophytica]UGQ46656.1 hypothetical protein LSQ66_23295 [Massilia endophytica]